MNQVLVLILVEVLDTSTKVSDSEGVRVREQRGDQGDSVYEKVSEPNRQDIDHKTVDRRDIIVVLVAQDF